jgi:hypothetical protein
MKVEMLRRHLAMAEGYVKSGERHLDQQRRIVGDLESIGHPRAALARALLATLEDLQREHLGNRDFLRSELDHKSR